MNAACVSMCLAILEVNVQSEPKYLLLSFIFPSAYTGDVAG